MTNEEAVKMLRTMQRTVYLGNRKFEDAIDCAIKAFSEPLQPWEVLAAQVVLPQPEIVRCKDCKYAEYIDDVKTLWCTECGQGRTVAPYDFCSYGERREDGQNR